MDESINETEFPIPFAFSNVDREGNILSASSNWNELGFKGVKHGRKIDEVINAFWGIFPLSENQTLHLPMILSAKKKFLDFDITPSGDHFVVYALDVTEKALAVQELQQVRNELELLHRDIRRTSPKNEESEGKGQEALTQLTKNLIYTSRLAALGEMASGLSHEVNNPLMIIQGSSEMMERKIKGDPELQKKFGASLTRIKEAVIRIAYIIKGLKDFSGQTEATPKEIVTVASIVNETFVFCFEMLKIHEIRLDMEKVPKVYIECRPLQISQVLFNIIKNADEALMKANPARKWIRIGFKETDNLISIHISNGGELISFNDQGKVFHPFFTTKGPGKGIGLGLAIARGIIDEHGGELILDATAPHTTFVLTLKKSLHH